MTEAGKVLFQQSVVTLALRLLAQSALTELAKVKGSQAEAWLDASEEQVVHSMKSFVPTPNVPETCFSRPSRWRSRRSAPHSRRRAGSCAPASRERRSGMAGRRPFSRLIDGRRHG